MGRISRPRLSPHDRRLARAQGGSYDGGCARVFGDYLGGAREARLRSVQTMKLLIAGVSHKTAPVEVREQLAFRPEVLPEALENLKACEGVVEAVILSTCNRVEITLTTEDAGDPQAVVDGFLERRQSSGGTGVGPYLY